VRLAGWMAKPVLSKVEGARRRRGVVSRKKEQRRQAARQPCNRVRSDFTQVVKSIEGGTVRIHKAFLLHLSGQLPFLGLSIRVRRDTVSVSVPTKIEARPPYLDHQEE